MAQLASATQTWSGRCAEPSASDGDAPWIERGASLDRYTVLRCLGSGGFGVVYAAYDPALDRQVAVKVLRPDRRGEAYREGLVSEARALARLSHPNVVAIHDVGVVDGQVFMAMEMVEGVDLREWLAQRKRRWPQVLSLFVQAGRGIAAAHRNGLIHGDFKPSNAIVGPQGRVRVIDFGLVSKPGPSQAEAERACGVGDDGASPRRLAGTLGFMAPEQLRGEAIGVAVDQFSFCASVYRGLCGGMPFGADDRGAVLARIEAGQVTLTAAARRLPDRIRRVLLRGMSADPARRYPSMDALVSVLEARARPRWRRWGSAGVGAAVVVGGAWLALGSTPSVVKVQVRSIVAAPEICSGGGDKVAEVWDESRKEQIFAALTVAGTPHAIATWWQVKRRIDDYVATWRDAYQDACAATRVRSEQSEALMDLRLSCLDRRLQRVAATTELLAIPGKVGLERAAMITYFLPDLAECADAAGLRAVVPPPPQARESVERERIVLVQGRNLLTAGRFDEAVSVFEPAVARARALAYAPLTAEALLGLGEGQRMLGRHDQARTSLFEAAVVAQSGRDDYLLARVWSALVEVETVRRKYERGLEWAAMARATLERLGGVPALAATLEHNTGILFQHRGDPASAVTHYRRAIDRYQQAYGERYPLVAKARYRIGQVLEQTGQPEQARVEYEQARVIVVTTLGQGHPIEGLLFEAIARTSSPRGRSEAPP
ncbi:MAG: serine/threonine-protein kinase [Myxococcota bacterium]